MLETLTKRINQDENNVALKEAMVECSQIGTLHSDIEKVAFINDMTQVDTNELKEKLSKVEFCRDCPLEDNMQKLVQAAKAPLTETSLIESVVSTAKTLTMSAKDFDEIKEKIKIFNKTENDDIAKDCVKSFIKFTKATVKSVAKCHDDKPADAFIVATVNKLCKTFDCLPDLKESEAGKYAGDSFTKKAALIIKLNRLSKALSDANKQYK